MILTLTNNEIAPPFPRFGGKGATVNWYRNLLPPHLTYVEPYCGSAALLFGKPRSKVEVINDLDGDVYNFFVVLRDPIQSEALTGLLRQTPYSRQEFERCRATWGQSNDPVERARSFYVLSRQSFGSVVGESWAYGRTSMKSFHASLSMFEPICRRLEQVQIEHLPALDVITRYDTARTCMFVDPPYVPEARVRLNGYQHEMTADDHLALLRQLKTVRGKVMVCGYPSRLYDDELGDWRTVEREVAVPTGAVNESRPRRIEKVWMNFPDYKLVA